MFSNKYTNGYIVSARLVDKLSSNVYLLTEKRIGTGALSNCLFTDEICISSGTNCYNCIFRIDFGDINDSGDPMLDFDLKSVNGSAPPRGTMKEISKIHHTTRTVDGNVYTYLFNSANVGLVPFVFEFIFEAVRNQEVTGKAMIVKV